MRDGDIESLEECYQIFIRSSISRLSYESYSNIILKQEKHEGLWHVLNQFYILCAYMTSQHNPPTHSIALQ